MRFNVVSGDLLTCNLESIESMNKDNFRYKKYCACGHGTDGFLLLLKKPSVI